MSGALHPSDYYPTTLQGWERVLTAFLLRTDGGGNADPIRSFEITPETLAMACGLGCEHAEAAEGAFRKALLSDRHLTWCLVNGTWRTPSREVPNCMAMLSLSLLVDSLLDGGYSDQGQYRTKLRQWLGMTNSFMDLRGIATMWKELVAWLDQRVEEGLPYRRLELPAIPATWTHIGYTRYLSFPTRRDLRTLQRVLARNRDAANDPIRLIRILDPVVRSSDVSYGLKTAFDEFRLAMRAGTASTDHRFWRLLSRARVASGETEQPVGDFRIEYDEDGRRRYRISAGNSGSSSFPGDLGKAAAAPSLAASPNLGPTIRQGILFFRSIGLASWTAVGEPPTGGGRYHVAVAERHLRLASGAVAQFEQSGSWSLTIEPIGVNSISDILKRLGITNAKENVKTAGLVDGIRVGSKWLGYPRYLPHIVGSAGEVLIRKVGGDGGPELAWAGGRLTAECAIEGEYVLEDRTAGWSRRATLVSEADVHATLGGAGYSLPALSEWASEETGREIEAAVRELAWDARPHLLQDMVEALYASCRSGLAEGEALAIIGRAVGKRAWEVLRSLQEATFLDTRLRTRWRGRVFTLGRPTLRMIRIGRGTAVVVCGAVPSRLEADFRATVEAHGGAPFRHLNSDCLPIPLLGATGVGAKPLAEALGWMFPVEEVSPTGSIPHALPTTSVMGESYEVASAWDWSTGRFSTAPRDHGPLSLVRLVHPGGRDHDLYRVHGNDRRTFLSRHAAIIDAYARAGRPMFRYEVGELRRLTTEGALPLELARMLRLRSLINGGLTMDGWRYTVDEREAHRLRSMLPGLIEGLQPNMPSDRITFASLRGRGARRPIWTNGELTV